MFKKLVLLSFVFILTLSNSKANIVVPNLADPSIIYIPSIHQYLLSGTYESTDYLPFFLSSDGITFTLHSKFIPSDEKYRFCFIWAPEFYFDKNNTLTLLFSGLKIPKENKCILDNLNKVTTYKILLNPDLTQKATPELIDFNSYVNLFGIPFKLQSGPSGYEKHKCINDKNKALSNECENTIRIDTEYFKDPITLQEHLFYVWFGYHSSANNLISSFDLTKRKITSRINPFQLEYEKITEAPDVFYRNGKYYLIFSHGGFNGSYGLSYIYGGSLADLTSKQPHKKLLKPIFNTARTNCSISYNGQQIVFAGGHSSTIQLQNTNDFYIYYHINNYISNNSECHYLQTRHTVRALLQFNSNGEIIPLN